MRDVEIVQTTTNLSQNRHQNNFFKRALESRTNKANTQKSYKSIESSEVRQVILGCSFYYTALTTLTQLRLDILTGNNNNN